MFVSNLFYRIYQNVMKLACNFLNFTSPELLEGAGSIKRLPDFIINKGLNNILVITGNGSKSAKMREDLYASLDEKKIKYSVYNGVQANPTIDSVEEAVKVYKENRCQAIIAFGGGSPMDCAKACAARIANPKKTVSKMRGLLKVGKHVPAIFAVPTTAGTGSETTVAAVITDSKTHEKYAINDTHLIPPFAVLDAELTYGLPKGLTSTTGMDALTHAVEAYIGNSNTKNTKQKAEKAVELIFNNLYKAYENGTDTVARSNMLLASYYAGIAFTRAYVGYVHAIAHALGGLYGIAHGLANAIILPNMLEFYGQSIWTKLAKLADIAGLTKEGQSPEEKANIFISEIKEMNKKMLIPNGFKEIKEEDINLIIKRVFKESHPLYPVPKFMTKKDCRQILLQLMIKE